MRKTTFNFSELKNAHIFSNEKGSIIKFFLGMSIYVAALLIPEICIALIHKEPFPWGEALLTILVLVAIITTFYFITRLLAYRTKIFPKTENREGLHGVSFIFLLLVAFIVFFILI